MRDAYLQYLKSEMKEVIERLDLSNVSETAKKLRAYLRAVRVMSELPASEFTENSTEEVKRCEMQEIYDVENNIYIGEFHRDLAGGEFGSFRIFVPEKVIREMDVEEGDWVQARPIAAKTTKGVSRTLYDYEIVRKAEEKIPTKRCELKFAVVEYEESLDLFYIYHREREGLPMKLMIKERNAEAFRLEEGDLVDFAYWEGEEINGVVAWKHPLDFDIREAPKPKPKTKTKEASSDWKEALEEIYGSVFEGKTVVNIGFETMKTKYRDEVECRGGHFVYLTGDEKEGTLLSQSRDADLIVVFIEFVSHRAMYAVKGIAKQLDKKIVYMRKMGKESYVELLKSMLLPEEAPTEPETEEPQ